MTGATRARPRAASATRSAARAGMRVLGTVWPGVAAHVAERLWCRPPRSRPSARALAVLAAAEPLCIAADGGRVAAWAWGVGPLALLVHGWGGHAGQLTRFVAPLVAAGYRVLAFDAPGHGRSESGPMGPGRTTLVDFRWAIRLVAARVGQPRAVVAHSVGANATAWALADNGPRGPTGDRDAPGLFAPDRAVLVAPAAAPAAYAAQFGRALGLPDAVARRWQTRLAARLNFRWEELDMRRAPERVRTPPALVIHDRGDRSTPWTDGVDVAASWPGSVLHTTEGLGHRRILDDPDVIARAAAFLALGPADA